MSKNDTAPAPFRGIDIDKYVPMAVYLGGEGGGDRVEVFVPDDPEGTRMFLTAEDAAKLLLELGQAGIAMGHPFTSALAREIVQAVYSQVYEAHHGNRVGLSSRKAR